MEVCTMQHLCSCFHFSPSAECTEGTECAECTECTKQKYASYLNEDISFPLQER